MAGVTMTAPGSVRGRVGGEFTLALLSGRRHGQPPDGLGRLSWGNSLLDFWDDLLDDGRLDPRTSAAAGRSPRWPARSPWPRGRAPT